MITIHFINGKSLAARGQKVGAWRRLLIILRIPISFTSSTGPDKWRIRPQSVGYFQEIPDDVASARLQAHEAELARQGKKVVLTPPGMTIPGGQKKH